MRHPFWYALLATTALFGAAATYTLQTQMPAIYSMADYEPAQASYVISEDGEVIGSFAQERRTRVPIAELPKHVLLAFLAAEDADFYQHEGIDWWGVLRAIGKNLRPHAHLQGASTITQQTVKTLILGPERSMWRKVREAVLSRRLEQMLGKDEILGLYLNQIYFGDGAWGIEEAAKTFFGKSASQLSIAEAAILAAAPKNPGRYTLAGDRKATKARQQYVLQQMLAHKWITAAEAEQAALLPLPLQPPPSPWLAPARDYVEHIRRMLVPQLGDEMLLTGGLRIYVGLNARLQRAAVQALRQSIDDVARRRGEAPAPTLRFTEDAFATALQTARAAWRNAPAAPASCLGCAPQLWAWDWRQVSLADTQSPQRLGRAMLRLPLLPWTRLHVPVLRIDAQSNTATVDLGGAEADLSLQGMAWVRSGRSNYATRVGDVVQVGDVVAIDVVRMQPTPLLRLVPKSALQAAAVAIDVHSRMVRVMVGGAPGSPQGGFNRATQAKRQPGSAFKPIIYAAGLAEHSITPASLCSDSPVVIADPQTGKLWKPENYEDGRYDGSLTYRQALNRSKNTCSVRLLQRMGVDAALRMAQQLGINTALPKNYTLALGTGEVTPLELTNAMATLAAGGVLQAPGFVDKVLDRAGNDVWQQPAGSGKQTVPPEVAYVTTSMLQSVVSDGTARRATQLGRPLAGKTGTSQNSRDVWFTGYAPHLAASVWMGFDDNASLGRETGGSAALPAWVRLMGVALAATPAEDFLEPAHVAHVSIDPNTGGVRAISDGGVAEVFVEGTEPSDVSQALPSIFLEDQEEASTAAP